MDQEHLTVYQISEDLSRVIEVTSNEVHDDALSTRSGVPVEDVEERFRGQISLNRGCMPRNPGAVSDVVCREVRTFIGIQRLLTPA